MPPIAPPAQGPLQVSGAQHQACGREPQSCGDLTGRGVSSGSARSRRPPPGPRGQSRTGLYSGSHSGMFRLLISEAIFFRCPGFVTPIAVRSWGREGTRQPPAAAGWPGTGSRCARGHPPLSGQELRPSLPARPPQRGLEEIPHHPPLSSGPAAPSAAAQSGLEHAARPRSRSPKWRTGVGGFGAARPPPALTSGVMRLMVGMS